jgi:hypothetical protein
MTSDQSQQDIHLQKIEKEARKKVKDLKDFYIHLSIYSVINVFLVVLNLMTSPDYLWAIWPILGWGVGLFSHAVSVFGIFGLGSKAWEERKVREFMLAQQQGLSASQVRQLLRDELDEAAEPAASRRVIARLENLEAIVTSKDWDLVEGHAWDEKASQEETPGQAEARSEAEVARLARRVR